MRYQPMKTLTFGTMIFSYPHLPDPWPLKEFITAHCNPGEYLMIASPDAAMGVGLRGSWDLTLSNRIMPPQGTLRVTICSSNPANLMERLRKKLGVTVARAPGEMRPQESDAVRVEAHHYWPREGTVPSEVSFGCSALRGMGAEEWDGILEAAVAANHAKGEVKVTVNHRDMRSVSGDLMNTCRASTRAGDIHAGDEVMLAVQEGESPTDNLYLLHLVASHLLDTPVEELPNPLTVSMEPPWDALGVRWKLKSGATPEIMGELREVMQSTPGIDVLYLFEGDVLFAVMPYGAGERKGTAVWRMQFGQPQLHRATKAEAPHDDGALMHLVCAGETPASARFQCALSARGSRVEKALAAAEAVMDNHAQRISTRNDPRMPSSERARYLALRHVPHLRSKNK